MENTISFGALIRQQRETRGWPLRTVANRIEVDPSTLAKIERNKRPASETLIRKFSILFELDFQHLKTHYWSERLCDQLRSENLDERVLEAAAQKLKQYQNEQSA